MFQQQQTDVRNLFDSRLEILPSRYAEIDLTKHKSITAIDLNRCISFICYSESKSRGYMAYITHAGHVDDFIQWLESKNLDKSDLNIYLVGGNDETHNKSNEQYNLKDRSSLGIVNTLTEALSKAGYRICVSALYGEWSKDVSLTSDGQVIYTQRRTKGAKTINLTKS